MKRVAINQSNYIPWKGYFDIIHDVDLFIFHDDLQYTKNDWRNRNRVKTPQGVRWLTVPVGRNEHRLICEVALGDNQWAKDHWRKLKLLYGTAPYFRKYRAFFDHVYLGMKWERLSDLNQFLIKMISRDFLGITTTFGDSRDYSLVKKKHERVIELLGKVGGTAYVSGPAAKSYLDHSCFLSSGIELTWKDYTGYPTYRQFSPPFDHAVSILDLLFMVGDDAPSFIWGWRGGSCKKAKDY
ncbi:MAG: WbqC family protein [Candidatus Latescibacteria bacterium]|nr:WbqC family protein [Candidatus Latescibacterota bacterium]